MTLQFDATESDLALFLEEAAEQLQTLSDGLLRMERDAGDTQLLQAVFRAAHTLKGSSATIGHTRMADLTHVMESVLDSVRKGTLEVTTPVIDAMLGCVDALMMLNDEIVTKEPCDIAIDALAQLLRDVARVEAPAPKGKKKPAAKAQAAVSGSHDVEVEVTIDPTSEWPAVRAYQALMELAQHGTIIRSEPSEEQLQTGEGGYTLLVWLTTERDAAKLEKVAGGVTDVAAVEVRAASAAEELVRAEDHGPEAAGRDDERRRIDLGPEMRGAPVEEQLAQAGQRLSTASRVVKVDSARLDDLMNLAGELVIDRGRLAQVLRDLSARSGHDPAVADLAEVLQHLARLSDDLQEQIMLSRMMPVEGVFNRFPRMVRDLARKSGKLIDFVIEGEQTGLDRSVIDEIGDPLLHLLRNAVDHGVETPEERVAAGKAEEATLRLAARHEESYIIIDVADDGRGIDPEKVRASAIKKGVISADTASRLSDDEAINLVFAPGFSTSAVVTDVSGRGVGMDIVRTNIDKVGGAVTVQTEVGQGTTFTIKMPLTLAIIRALLVRVGEGVFTIPLTAVHETMRVPTDTIRRVYGRDVVEVRGQMLPLVRLADVFSRSGGRSERPATAMSYVVIVRSRHTDLGLIVDALIGEQEVVIKSMGSLLGEIEGVAGATILGDGRVSMLIDVPKVVDKLAALAT